MNAYQAQRLRFGILPARHMLERWRMTDWQHDDLEGCKAAQWMVKDSQKAFDREHKAAMHRAR